MKDSLKVTLANACDVDDAVERATTAASDSLFQTVPYARAIEAAGGTVRLFHIEDAAGWAGHCTFIQQERLGHTTWVGLAHPAIRDEAARRTFWRAIADEGRKQGVLSMAWRESTLARLSESDLHAAQDASAQINGRIHLASFGTHLLSLDSRATAWEQIHRKHRNIIRKAREDGVTVTETRADEFVEPYAAISRETFARSGVPGPAEPYFHTLLAINEKACRISPYLAHDASGKPVAGAIIAEWRGNATYLHGASTGATGASNLLQWTLIESLIARGVKHYDFGGAAIPGSLGDNEKAIGIRRFKERYGGAWQVWPQLQLQFDPEGYDQARAQARAAAEQAARDSQ